MKGRVRRLLVAAGPTREYIDPVRYISNDSSGLMGFSLAAAAARMGLSVTLVAGPVCLPTPAGVRRVDVVSARQMAAAVLRLARRADAVIMAAAVADYRPSRCAKRKIKRAASRSHGLTIPLTENPDILSELGRRRRAHQTLVGFALETSDLERNARAKLRGKGCDWIVANLATNIGAGAGSALLIGKNGESVKLRRMPKEELSSIILSHVLV